MATAEVALIRLAEDGATLQLGPFILTPTGLHVERPASFDEWHHAGVQLKRIEGAVQWWIGDWLAWGEGSFGERHAQALEASGYEAGTLSNCAYVAKAVPPSRRRESVPFSVHQEVAPLPPDEQDRWLEKAEAEQLTRAAVRSAIRRERLGAPASSRGLQPDGSIVAIADDGEIRLTCKVVDGQITLGFERPVRWLGLSVTDARALAHLLTDRILTTEQPEAPEGQGNGE